MPLSLFNRGQYDVARSQAEQSRVAALRSTLERQIRAEVQGALQLVTSRRKSLLSYQESLQGMGGELTRITRVAYEEGEIGILELLDALRVARTSSLRLLNLQESLRESWIELDRVVGEEVRP